MGKSIVLVLMALAAGCTTQPMAKAVDYTPTSTGPTPTASAGPVATQLAQALTAAGLDINDLPALDDVPDSQIIGVMKAFSTALGASCSDCHVADKATDTPRKRVARKMWDEFVLKLNRADGSPLFCDSCHQGKITFLDRTDDMKLSSFMDANYVDGVKRKDGSPQSCTSCHGSPFDPTFLDGWENGLDGGLDGGIDASTHPTVDGGVDASTHPAVDAGTAPDLAHAPDMTTIACTPSVNEVQVAGSKSASDEFIELYNPCGSAYDLSGHRLVYRSGAGTSDTLLVALDGQSIPASGYLVVGNTAFTGTATVHYTSGLASSAGGVALEKGTVVVDSVAWGTATNAFVQGAPASAPPAAQSIARIPDGSHANANQSLDLRVGAPTPGASN